MKEGSISTLLSFPRPWPLGHRRTLLVKSEGSWSLEVVTDGDGHIEVLLGEADRVTKHRFQRVTIHGSGEALLSVSWSADKVSLYVNKTLLMLADEAEGVAFALNDDKPQPSDVALLPSKINTVQEGTKTEEEHLFLGTVADIQQKLQDGSKYAIIRAAGLLRQLFLDSTPLMVKVNSLHRLKLTFTILDPSFELPIPVQEQWKNPDPSGFPGARTVQVTLQQLLKTEILLFGGQVATVKDLITACANVKGGIHLGRARTPGVETIVSFDKVFGLLGDELSVFGLSGLCRVALNGLKPLIERAISTKEDKASTPQPAPWVLGRGPAKPLHGGAVRSSPPASTESSNERTHP